MQMTSTRLPAAAWAPRVLFMLGLGLVGCRTTAPPADQASSTPASSSLRAAGPAAAPESAAQADAAATDRARPAGPERAGGVLLDYYRDDSRGYVQALESRLRPLEVVHPEDGPFN